MEKRVIIEIMLSQLNGLVCEAKLMPYIKFDSAFLSRYRLTLSKLQCYIRVFNFKSKIKLKLVDAGTNYSVLCMEENLAQYCLIEKEDDTDESNYLYNFIQTINVTYYQIRDGLDDHYIRLIDKSVQKTLYDWHRQLIWMVEAYNVFYDDKIELQIHNLHTKGFSHYALYNYQIVKIW